MQTRLSFGSQSWQPMKRLRFLPNVERANEYFLILGKNVRKIQNAAVIPATEMLIFRDLGEACNYCNKLSLIVAYISQLICVQNGQCFNNKCT